MTGQKQIDKLLVDFLPAANSIPVKAVKKRKQSKAENRPLTLKQKVLVKAYTNIGDPKTFGNGRQSAMVAYNIPSDKGNLAGVIAHAQLTNANVMNYLEEHCNKMGIGVEVRLDSLRKFIAGKGTSTTTVRHKTVNPETGRLKLTRVQEIEAPPRIHDRIAAIKELNNMTGFYKQQEIDKQIALSEVSAMYDKIVGRGTGKPA